MEKGKGGMKVKERECVGFAGEREREREPQGKKGRATGLGFNYRGRNNKMQIPRRSLSPR